MTIALLLFLDGIWKLEDGAADAVEAGAGVGACEVALALVGGRLPRLDAGRSEICEALRDMLGGW